MQAMIELKEVEKEFSGQVIIPPLSLKIEEGEFFTLLGPSGCGKTTLMRMIAGLELPSKGEILLAGQAVTKLPPYKRDVNMVFQQYALFPHMSVEENICFGLKMKKVALEEQKKRAEEVMALTELMEYRYRRPKELSGGQQQRVAIARAIVNNPKVLLLDEPLGALDFQLRKHLQLELKKLQKNLGLTFLYVTHDQEEAITMSDRIAVMNKGQLEQIGSAHEIYHKPKTRFVATFIGENNIFQQDERYYALRPEKINLHDPLKTQECTYPLYRGIIEDIVFLGNIDKVFVRMVDESLDLSVFMAYQYFDDKRRWQVGEEVLIGWESSGAVRVGS
ncbi:ABC transporter ATP-binding protein [Heliorestis convoluta]|uniref:Spermidine/putrescine abc transporter, ATP-binding protein PotA n=1 Tax=Heliorestis convoluta TaxID=356322 RepID=A0A5Q2N0K7_9FIRM|nr:ABC transporter ATP-binding protein [Heliorestis convoluta]QGG48407.1 Spermidine/putrescine abc transporter, ATP-binding protein PotA [Heliorestis convoluta]